MSYYKIPKAEFPNNIILVYCGLCQRHYGGDLYETFSMALDELALILLVLFISGFGG